MAITLNTVNKSLELITSSAATTHVSVSYVDTDNTTLNPKESNSLINTAGTTTILAAPASGFHHGVKNISIFNAHATLSVTVTVQLNANSTLIELVQATLSPNESLQWSDAGGWYSMDIAGRVKTAPTERTGFSGFSTYWYKPMTTAEAAGYWYCSSKDAGAPGAWSPGTPGLAGRATDGTAAGDLGCIPVPNPGTGTNYITLSDCAANATGWHMLFDLLWVNTGIVVTTTTAQTINSVAFPARDLNGTVNGEGCMIGLLFTAAGTNAAVISNSTVTYTNSNGVGSKTATLSSNTGANIPATPVIGTLVWFRLDAGCKGVQSIQSITLGTSLGAGSVSLIVARPLISNSVLSTSAGTIRTDPMNPGVKLYNNTCMLHCTLATGANTTTANGIIVIQER